MRWKLLIITSLLATIVGAGATLGLALGLTGSAGRLMRPDLYAALSFLVPIASISFASLFVYRHTARWRKTQALATALLSILLTLSTIIAASVLLSSDADREPPPPTPRNNA